MTPTFSVVTATYNRAHTLARALRSVLAQDFTDWELIVVDDGSSDDTAALLAGYDDPRIRVLVHPENRGVTAAKNTGLDHARGVWITTLDSDDELLPGALREAKRVIDERGDLDALACNCEDANTGGLTGRGLDRDQYIDLSITLARCVGEHWGMFHRRILGDRRFNPRMVGMEWTLWLKIYDQARWYYVHKALRRYHTDAGERVSTARFGDPRRDQKLYASFCALIDEEAEFLAILKRRSPRQYEDTLSKAAGQFALEGDHARFEHTAALLRQEGVAVTPALWRVLLSVSPVARAGRRMVQTIAAPPRRVRRVSTNAKPLTLEDLMAMQSDALHAVLCAGHPLDLDALAGRQFLGVDLSLPAWGRRLLWHTFRKTFVRDARTGELRGWNVRMHQLGVRGPRVPMTDRNGVAVTFGHYRVREAVDGQFSPGYRGRHYLDYGTARNTRFDVARFGRTPLVAVNAGSQKLLLGWEVLKVGPTMLPLPLYWALEDEGPVDQVIDPPR